MSKIAQRVAELKAHCETLASLEPAFKELIGSHGIPPLLPRENGFESLVQVILEQQVSLESAKGRLVVLNEKLKGVNPDSISRAGESGLRALGVTRQKAGYLVDLAGRAGNGSLRLDRLPDRTDDEVRRILLGVRGVGPWTASVYLILVLDRADIWPTGDVALLTSYAEVYGRNRPTQEELAAHAARWSPYRSAAARMLWHAYLCRRGRT